MAMSATEELRELLNERGVEWTANDGEYVKETCWPYMGELTSAFAEYYNGTTRFVCDTWCFTPEQAVEATMGPTISGFLTHDGMLHVTCGMVPERIEVTLPDERGREVHSARVHEFERRRECRITEDEDTGFLCCSECGAIQPEDYTVYYCWDCGARVAKERIEEWASRTS